MLWPILPRFLEAHPDIRFELTLDDGLTDIVAHRYDAGIRFGGALEKDMIAIRVSPEVRVAIVGSASYSLEDLTAEHLARGELIRVLEDWSPMWPGCHLYYPSRRQMPPALAALIEALRVEPVSEPKPRTKKPGR